MRRFLILACVLLAVGFVLWRSDSYQVHPYNGDALGARINQECAGILLQYMKPGEKTRLSLDKYVEMRTKLNSCMARK